MKQNYLSPQIDVLEIGTADIICGSYDREMNFGGRNAAGTIDDDDVVNGGSF